VTRPMVRTGVDWDEVGWDEAFAHLDERLTTVLAAHGTESLAVYVGNPASYDLALSLYTPAVFRIARHRFSPATVDTFPKQMANGHLFGGEFTIPMPDLVRTDLVWILGANPAVSNGSLMVTPDVTDRLQEVQRRGGRVVVFDPRRTATADRASEYHAIRPGTDALFLAAVLHTLYEENLTHLRHLAPFTNGVDELRRAVEPFAPEGVGPACRIDADQIRRLARELSAADRAVVYGRLGTCTQEFGTLASWFIEALNVVTGNLDRPGGAMFAWPFTGSELTMDGPPRLPRRGRWSSRVRGAPEVMGELPVACLAEEILTAGTGRIRALLTVAGNPALSVPDPRIGGALADLDMHVALDVYLNETTRHAHVLLPAEAHLQRPHMPLTQHSFMSRQVARWTEPSLPPDDDRPRDWQMMLRLWSILTGRGTSVPFEVLDDELFVARVSAEVRRPGSPVNGRAVDDIVAAAGGSGPERIVDFMVRCGPLGDGFGAHEGGLTLAEIKRHPHGLDLGGLEPRLPGALKTESGRIELAPGPLLGQLPALATALQRSPAGSVQLVGRRDVRTNNSWMHNVAGLARGKDRSRLQVNPQDATRLGLATGVRARVVGAQGEVVVEVEVTDAVMCGVVSLPHGWGHDAPGTRQAVAATRPGANVNVLADPFTIDPLTGTSVVNGFAVTVEPLLR
jgi:anaerobic selenocysteine-containing dehydrogenase